MLSDRRTFLFDDDVLVEVISYTLLPTKCQPNSELQQTLISLSMCATSGIALM